MTIVSVVPLSDEEWATYNGIIEYIDEESTEPCACQCGKELPARGKNRKAKKGKE